ncbi:MAG: 23S rRNA (uracil(1939)-C(5))-methyltransferase RlmD [Lachnospiraceae bacterium]|nr:23S rRNA (uracil(1939)-C(5))-methyltransferase RlmD [Lachnospiraceae bacterium]
MGHEKYQKNDIVTVTIDDIGNDGEGIGKADGYTLFVKDAVIGDTVEARITKCKKNYGYARVEKVITPSSFRVEPKCRLHRQCGGCQIQAMSYERQLKYKQDKVRNHLLRIGGFPAEMIDAVTEPIVGMEEPWHYRNKAQYPVGYDKNGNLITGFYAGRTHDIIANTDCALGVPENKDILEAVLDYMKENNVTAYRETEGTGLVRHVLIRTGFQSGEIMVCVVINGKKLPEEGRLVEKLTGLRLSKKDGNVSDGKETADGRMTHRRVAGISVSVNTEKTNVIMGKEIRVLWGQDRIHDTLGGISFAISPLSFYQVNPVQTEKLYGLALDYAGLTGKETVWDLYCGIGTISLFMAKKAKQVYGVEVIPEAIEDARENARDNGIENVEFYVGKAEEILPAFYGGTVADGISAFDKGKMSLADEQMRHPDVIVVDPPRKGCDEKCLETMIAMRPERIVYVSCDSATLARDLKVLCAGGYELAKVRAVDQFGHSVHVEVIIMMQYCGKEKN